MWVGLAALEWLAAVDLDVARLPDRILVPATIWTTLGVAVTMWITSPLAGAGASLAAALCGGGFQILHLVGGGKLGFGDVKLARAGIRPLAGARSRTGGRNGQLSPAPVTVHPRPRRVRPGSRRYPSPEDSSGR